MSEQTVNKRIDDLRADMGSRFDQVISRLDKIDAGLNKRPTTNYMIGLAVAFLLGEGVLHLGVVLKFLAGI